jgi:hypothetical protein
LTQPSRRNDAGQRAVPDAAEDLVVADSHRTKEN